MAGMARVANLRAGKCSSRVPAVAGPWSIRLMEKIWRKDRRPLSASDGMIRHENQACARGLLRGASKGANARQEEMTYGAIRLCRGSGKKQGYGLDRTLGTLSIIQQPDDYALFGLDRAQADNRELAIWFSCCVVRLTTHVVIILHPLLGCNYG